MTTPTPQPRATSPVPPAEAAELVARAPGRVIVVSGPSGVGKDTVLRELFALRPDFRYSVSYTTRAPRAGEEPDVAYSFVDDGTFDEMVARGEFLEWALVHGHRYGTSLRRVLDAVERGEVVVLNIDVQGAATVRSKLPRERALFIFLDPPSKAELRHRLQTRRSDDNAAVEARLDAARDELHAAPQYDHRVLNDDVHRAAQQLLQIIERGPSP